MIKLKTSSINFIGYEAFPVITLYHVRKLKKGSDPFLPCGTWSVNYEWYGEIAIWSSADTLSFRLRAKKMFFMKFFLILPKIHEKTPYVPNFSFALGTRVVVLRGKIFQRGVWWVGTFRVGIIPWGIYLEPVLITEKKNFISIFLVANMSFSQSVCVGRMCYCTFYFCKPELWVQLVSFSHDEKNVAK